MKIPKDINQKLAKVPVNKRVFIYDATLIIEFLNATFMPMEYYFTHEAFYRIGGGSSIKRNDLKNPEKYADSFLSLYQMYEYYKMFRNNKDYTKQIESRYQFSIIIKKLNLSKNRWQFEVKRVGRAQLIYVGPVELRVKVPIEIRKKYPVPTDREPSEIKIVPRELQQTTLRESEQPTKPDEVIDPTLT